MLQGSLENFALDEVLGLLAGTSKTGQLEIAGNRGAGKLSFSDGRLVDGTASYTANGTDLEDVMFELLRYDDGTFSFVASDVAASDSAENVATVLSSAENRLRDWRSIEAIVPTLKHQVAPSSELPADEITIDRSEWAALTVIASGCPVSLVCDRLELGEVEGSRQIKNLAERKLVTLGEPIGGYNAVSRSTQSATEPPLPPPGFGTPNGADAMPAAEPAGTLTDTLPETPADRGASLAESTTLNLNGVDPTSIEGQPIEGQSLEAPAGDISTGSAEVLLADRPPMPPAPDAGDLQTDISDPLAPPEPPSPAEISNFGDEIEDASELGDESEEAKGGGGLLARYLKSDD